MLKWVCLQHHHQLYQLGEKYFCPRCRESYRLQDNIPIFINDNHRISDESGILRDFWRQIRMSTVTKAISEFSNTHRCLRNYKLTDWKFFLNGPYQSHILELGGGYGEDTT